MSPKDPATCANVEDFQMNHVALRVEIDMDKCIISSQATLSITRTRMDAISLLLDIFKLEIHSIHLNYKRDSISNKESSQASADNQENASKIDDLVQTTWRVNPFTTFGDMLCIDLPINLTEKDANFQVIITYNVLKDSPGVSWLTKEQTSGHNFPYMFTIGQEVLNRSLFPCQDSPAVRITYTAEVTVAKPFVCVMSASKSHSEIHTTNTTGEIESRTFYFEMEYSIPVYLVAMAIGNLQSARIGPRSQVWAEPCMLERAKNEFQGIVETYLQIGERLFGEYRWGHYDILVMPPGFAYGGMENPCLTYVSPTIIAGDGSLTTVVGHEICHSWFGNLVTNSSWSDFFLNEGFTMYAERRLQIETLGRPLMALDAKLGLALLRDEVAAFGAESPLTRLRVPVESGIHPGECYNQCAYEKGFAFVSYLASLVGSEEIFDNFLKDYCENFSFQSITPEDMIAFFIQKFPHLGTQDGELKGPISFATWLNEPGMPQFEVNVNEAQDLMLQCESLALHWRASGQDVPVQASVLYLSHEAHTTWPVFQVLYFLDCLVEERSHTMSTAVIEELGTAFGIWTSLNFELQFRWAQLLILEQIESKLDFIAAFLHNQGKLNYQKPIYRLLCNSPNKTIQEFAKQTFQSTRSALNVAVVDRIEAIMKEKLVLA